MASRISIVLKPPDRQMPQVDRQRKQRRPKTPRHSDRDSPCKWQVHCPREGAGYLVSRSVHLPAGRVRAAAGRGQRFNNIDRRLPCVAEAASQRCRVCPRSKAGRGQGLMAVNIKQKQQYSALLGRGTARRSRRLRIVYDFGENS